MVNQSKHSLNKLTSALAIAMLLFGIRSSVSVSHAATEQPNVVLIISDDQAYCDFGFMGNKQVRTPHLDRLASQSAQYPNGYVTASVCRPSLATLLTGLYPHQHGIHFNHPPPGFKKLGEMSPVAYLKARQTGAALIERTPTLPRILSKLGYLTLQTGKHWEGHYSQAGFTHGMTLNQASRDSSLGNRKLRDGTIVAHGNGDAGLQIGRSTMKPIYDFVDTAKRKKKPFLIWYAPFLPHTPHDAPERLQRIYREDANIPRHLVRYFASITQFDKTVGQLISHLEKEGLARNTLFVFVSDNGWQPLPSSKPNSPSIVDTRTKRSPFEFGLRTPILLRWDGKIKPATHQTLVSTVDIVPTVLGATTPKTNTSDLPGINLLPSASGKNPLTNRDVYGAIYPGDASSLLDPEHDVAYRWIRSGDYKLIVPHAQQGVVWRQYVKGPALFHLRDDPSEANNLYTQSNLRGVRTNLQKKLNAWWSPSGNR